jgi:hypothetical protein
MSKSIVLDHEQWKKLKNRLSNDYNPSVILIRKKMKDVLGFTVRDHEEWIDQEVDISDVKYGARFCIQTIRLDFYNEPKRTMFLLKYGEYIDDTTQSFG